MLEAISISWERGFHCHRAGSAVMYRRRGTVIDMENSKEYYVRDEDGQIVGFNYDCIGADENLKISLRQLAEKIFGILKVRFKHTFDIGTELRLAKTAIKFGGFTEWLETVALGAGYSRKTFGNWMAVAKRFGPPLALIADLDFPKSVDEFDIGANAAVTLTKCSDKGIIEAVRRAANGEKITDDVAKEILSRLPAPPKAKGKETATNKESTPAGKPAAPPVPDASNPEQAPVENGAVEAKGEGTPSPEEPSDTGAEGELAGDSPELAQSAIVAKEMGADECAISVPSEDATSDSADVDDNTNPDPRVLQVNKTGDHYAAGTWNIWNIKETDTDDAWGGPLDVVPPSSESQAQQNLLVCHGLDGKT